jgi:hypothetical protein
LTISAPANLTSTKTVSTSSFKRDHSAFSKNRDLLQDADVAAKFLEAVQRHPQVKRFLSDDHVWVDGTLVDAWASLKSFRAKDGSDESQSPGRNGERYFDGEKRANDTHENTSDPEWVRGGALLNQKIQALLKVSSFALRASMAGLAMVETPGTART